MYKWTYQTKMGAMTIGATAHGITYLQTQDTYVGEFKETHLIQKAHSQLVAYLSGNLRDFDLPLAPLGTAFQKQVWQALCEIPIGETITYTELASRIGKPTAVRATGAANGKNPIYIIIPCHRVIGRDGALRGYAGGLEMKAKLLRLEGAKIE